MELKPDYCTDGPASLVGLNRTFYGIETLVLHSHLTSLNSLNRTFYGIETRGLYGYEGQAHVLIVPFMELKPRCGHPLLLTAWRLNRTFYGIETAMK